MTIRDWPDSTADSTASDAASAANGTSSVTRQIGRTAERCAVSGAPERGRWRVATPLLRPQVPGGRLTCGSPHAPPPERHVEEHPRERDDRRQEDELLVHEDDQRDEHREREEREAEDLQPVPTNPAQQALVVGRRDLTRVPPQPAFLALPALAVGDEPGLAALAANRD